MVERLFHGSLMSSCRVAGIKMADRTKQELKWPMVLRILSIGDTLEIRSSWWLESVVRQKSLATETSKACQTPPPKHPSAPPKWCQKLKAKQPT